MTEDPRNFGLTADELRAVADRLYDSDDQRLDPMTEVSARFGRTRSRLRSLADAIDAGHAGHGEAGPCESCSCNAGRGDCGHILGYGSDCTNCANYRHGRPA